MSAATDGDILIPWGADPYEIHLNRGSKCWDESFVDSQWIIFDLGEAIPVRKIEIYMHPTRGDLDLIKLRYKGSQDLALWTNARDVEFEELDYSPYWNTPQIPWLEPGWRTLWDADTPTASPTPYPTPSPTFA